MNIIRKALALVLLVVASFLAGAVWREHLIRGLLLERNLASYNSKTAAFELLTLAEVAGHPDMLMPLPTPDPLPEVVVRPTKKVTRH